MESLGLAENDWSLDEVRKKHQELVEELLSQQKDLITIVSSFKQAQAKAKPKTENPYQTLMEKMTKQNEELTYDIGSYSNVYEQRNQIDKWYYNELEKLKKNAMQLSDTELQKANQDLATLYDLRSTAIDAEIWQERGKELGDIFGSGLKDVMTSYQDFSTDMKEMATDVCSYIVKESAKSLIGMVMNTQKMRGVVQALNQTAQGSGFTSIGANILKGIGKSFGIFHSGGVVPVGANASLPGTQEQLALLKGGERILSPSENTSYTQEQATTPIVMNNFNIKAWDSKDVQKYLTENKQLINQITFEAIKNNYCQLRNMVRNA